MTYGPDDLTPFLIPPSEGDGFRYSQGVLLSWNPITFENEVEWEGITLPNLPVLPHVDALGFEVGAVLGLAGWNPGGGAGSWSIFGRIDIPPIPEPPSIKGGNLNVESGGSVRVKDGGDVIVDTDGEIRSVNFDGDMSSLDPGTQGWGLGNDRLALAGVFAPAVDFESLFDSDFDFDIPTGGYVAAAVTFTVPSWAQEVAIAANGLMSIENTSGVSSFFSADLDIDGVSVGVAPGFIQDNDHVNITIPFSRTFNVTSIASFDVELILDVSDPWPAAPLFRAFVSAQATWKSPQ